MCINKKRLFSAFTLGVVILSSLSFFVRNKFSMFSSEPGIEKFSAEVELKNEETDDYLIEKTSRERTDFEKEIAICHNWSEILAMHRGSNKNLAISFGDLTTSSNLEHDKLTSQVLNYLPNKYSFTHADFYHNFKENCQKLWKEWVIKKASPHKISITDKSDDPNNKEKDIRIGIRFLMLEKTSGGMKWLVKGAKSSNDSMGLLSVPFNPRSTRGREVKNIPPDWIYSFKKEKPNGPFSFEIADYRPFTLAPISESSDRKIVKPTEERKDHLVEKFEIPFPGDLSNIILTPDMKEKIVKVGELGENDDLYFCYSYDRPSLNSPGLFVTKNVKNIGEKAVFIGRKSYSGSIFYIPYKMHESKFKFRTEPAIFVKVPANAEVKVYFEEDSNNFQTYTLKDFVNKLVRNELLKFQDDQNIIVKKKLLSEISLFNEGGNIFLWEITVKNKHRKQSFLIEDYQSFSMLNFLNLDIVEKSFPNDEGKLTEIPIFKLSISPEGEKLIENLHNLQNQYDLLRNEILPRVQKPDNVLVIQRLLEDIEEKRIDFTEVQKFIDKLDSKYLLTDETIDYTPRSHHADWYKNAVVNIGINLSKVSIGDWSRVLGFFANFLDDKINVQTSINGRESLVTVFENNQFIEAPVISADVLNTEEFKSKSKYEIEIIELKFSNQQAKNLNFTDVFNYQRFWDQNNLTNSSINMSDDDNIIYSFDYSSKSAL